MRRSTVLSLPPQLAFSGWIYQGGAQRWPPIIPARLQFKHETKMLPPSSNWPEAGAQLVEHSTIDREVKCLSAATPIHWEQVAVEKAS
jgi:hypothetical protein